MNYSSAIDKRGRITVPLEVRIRLGLSAGDRVEFVVEDERIVFRPAPPGAKVFEEHAGILGKVPGGKK